MSQGREVVVLVSCVKTKQTKPAPARDLYISALFRGMRRYAEARADRWFILSAKHGLLTPDRMTGPYEQTLKTMRKADRDAWAARVTDGVKRTVSHGSRLVLLAGADYVDPLLPRIEGIYVVDVPLKGLKLGQRLKWLHDHSS